MKPKDPFYPGQPEYAYVVVPGSAEVGRVTRGYRGYVSIAKFSEDVKFDDNDSQVQEAQRFADRYNATLGVSKAQAEAALVGSMAGWNVPAANPAECEKLWKN